MTTLIYERDGFCPICDADVRFTAAEEWYRDHLFCSGCGSIPRERALALVLERQFRNWRSFAIHARSEKSRPVGDLRTGLAEYIDHDWACPVLYGE